MGNRIMDSRPPALMEQIVRHLVPPAARESVMGDLSERYVSPGHYLSDALRVLPFIVVSRIRRTCNVGMLGFLAFVFWYAIFNGIGQFNGMGRTRWLVPTIPTILVLVTLVLRDAYRTLKPTWPRQAVIDVVIAAAGVALFEILAAAAAPQLLLPRFTLLFAATAGCVLLYFLRLQSPSGFLWPPPSAHAMSMTELFTEVRGFESVIRRAIRIEIGAAFFVVVGFSAFFLAVPYPVEKAGCALSAAGALFVTWFLFRHARVQAMPASLGFAESVAFYRQSLGRRSALARSYVWWYVLPLMVGPAVIIGGRVLRHPNPLPTLAGALATLVVIVTFLVFMQRQGIQKLQRRIAQISVVTEKTLT